MALVFVKVCRAADVPPGELRQFNIRGTEILVANVDNQLFCLEARCTHAGAPLAEGDLTGEVIVCPWHGSRFNATNGSVLGGPAKKQLRVYSSTVKEETLLIEL